MTRISNYDELKLEKKRLQQHLKVQKESLRHEIAVVKERIEPFLEIISFFGFFKKKEGKNSLLKIGAQAGVGLLLNQTLLSKAGWLTKLVVPFVLKGVSSSVIDRIKK